MSVLITHGGGGGGVGMCNVGGGGGGGGGDGDLGGVGGSRQTRKRGVQTTGYKSHEIWLSLSSPILGGQAGQVKIRGRDMEEPGCDMTLALGVVLETAKRYVSSIKRGRG